MNDISRIPTSQQALRSGSNGQVEVPVCPCCGHPISNERAQEIQERFEKLQRALTQKMEEEFKRKQQQIETAARSEGFKVAEAAAQKKLAEVEQQKNEALGRVETLEANMEAVVNQRVGEGVEACRQQTEAKYAADALLRIQENQKLNEHVAKLQRDLANRKPTDLGDSAERDTHRDLTAAFPLDKITQVAKGTKGGDIPHFVNHKGNQVGGILHEIKNVKNWSDSYAIKARADKVAGKFDYAVVTTTKLPAGERDLAFREHCVICSPALTVGVTRMLRAAIIKVSEARAEGKDGDKKAAELWDFFTSGQGRELLLSASDDITKLRALDKTLLNHAKKHVDDSEKVYKTQEQKFDDIFAAIDRIIETD